MGVYVIIERWGTNNPVLETIKVVKEDGIEIKIPLDLFINRASKQISENLTNSVLESISSKKIYEKASTKAKIALSKSEDVLKSEIAKIVKEIREATIQVADMIC